jgi:pimeloyl-ACP methyl ester carboxylesterase
MKHQIVPVTCALLLLLVVGGCASDYRYREGTYDQPVQKETVLRSLHLDPALEEKVLALDPEHLTEQDVREVLSKGPTPRIINIHGGLPLLEWWIRYYMESFSKFLIGMGYPEGKIRNPRNGAYSYSSYKSSEKLAGIAAWYYEKEGMRVMMVGHSLGAMQAIKVLHQLGGAFNKELDVWDPITEDSENRHTIIDPLTGVERPVVGTPLGYVSVVGAGGFDRLLPEHWRMLGKLRRIPNTVEHFTGVFIDLDFIGGDLFGLGDFINRYTPEGAAKVRNVRLPPEYSHITVPDTVHLAENKATRDWINAYAPTDRPRFAQSDPSTENILWAADVWYSIKKQWCLEAQRLIRAKRKIRDLVSVPPMAGH